MKYEQHKTMEEPEFARTILILDVPGLKVTGGCLQTVKR